MPHDDLWAEHKAVESLQRDAVRRVDWLERRLQRSNTQAEYAEWLEELHKAEAEVERITDAYMKIHRAWCAATNPFTQ